MPQEDFTDIVDFSYMITHIRRRVWCLITSGSNCKISFSQS